MINYHFFGKECFIDKDLKDRGQLKKHLDEKSIIYSDILLLNQVHGNEVVIIDDKSKIYGTQNLPKADGIVTNLKNIIIGVVTADCAPVVFIDDENSIIGICHAGWKGAKSGILESTVIAMKKIGAKNIKAIIGPTIQQYSYQISKDFFDDFIIENPSSIAFFKESKEVNKWQFNLPLFIIYKLNKVGVNDIEDVEIDTYTNYQNFSSFRRSTHLGEDLNGRNVSVVCLC